MEINSGISFKLKETSCETWNLIKLLPLIIGDKTDKSSKVWGCLLKFVILVERLSSPSFSKSDLMISEVIVEDFFWAIKKISLPKAHFLRHYPDVIRQFDPLVKTLRFESKHQYLNSISQMAKNRKKVCQLLAKRRQFMMYLHYSKEYFLDQKSIHIFDSKETSCKALDYFDKNAVHE